MFFLGVRLIRDINANQYLVVSSDKGNPYFFKKLEPEYKVLALLSEVEDTINSSSTQKKILNTENKFFTKVDARDFKRTFVGFLLDPEPLWHFFGAVDYNYTYDLGNIFLT